MIGFKITKYVYSACLNIIYILFVIYVKVFESMSDLWKQLPENFDNTYNEMLKI